LFEFEGRIDLDGEGEHTRKNRILHLDENLTNAVELRQNKSKHSDFFFKLHELKERIQVYNEVFRSKVPRYLRGDTLKVGIYATIIVIIISSSIISD
jgi:hypothetical protein